MASEQETRRWESVARETKHRPWPVPERPWSMTMSWHDLLFAHWPVSARKLARLLPPGLELDLWEGEGWVGVVPFLMTNVGPRGLSRLPWISHFPELNVRTYVSVADKPGVYFFSLDAANPLAVAVARWRFQLPYFHAVFRIVRDNDRVSYRCTRRRDKEICFDGDYHPTGEPFAAKPGSFESWLVERYCLYTVNKNGKVFRGDIQHPPWPLQNAETELHRNTMVACTGLALPDVPPITHFAKRLDVVGWTLDPVNM